MFQAIDKVKNQGAFPILSTVDIFKQLETESFVEMSVKELLWGSSNPILQFAKELAYIDDDHYGIL